MFGQSQSSSAPLNRYPLWKYILILVLLVLSLVYALPNIFGESPAVQVSPKGGKPIPVGLATKVKNDLLKVNIPFKSMSEDKTLLEFRFDNTVNQLKAQDEIKALLGNQYSVALNLAANTPKWLLDLGANPMKYGLDLRGGMYFLLDIDMQTVIDNNLNNISGSLRNGLRQEGIRYSDISVKKHEGIALSFRTDSAMSAAERYIGTNMTSLVAATDTARPHTLFYTLSTTDLSRQKDYAVSQVVQVMRNRVNELGVAEASVARQGSDRVVIELPGVQDAAKAKEILGVTATLKVMMVNTQADVAAAVRGEVPIASSLYKTDAGVPYVLHNKVVITGNSVVGANSGFDQRSNLPAVFVDLSGPDVSYFSKVTRQNIGKPMAIVLVQSNYEKRKVDGKIKNILHTSQKVISVATIQSALGNNFQITGIGSSNEAQTLALMIRAGALPAPVQIAEERQIGPSLGLENIKMGTIATGVALILVVIFMALYYGLFGLIADIALVLNLVIIVAVMSIMPGATLTLPGIAGIVLNLGMAIDANVLIFERIREEVRRGTSLQSAIHAGYERAFSTIVDSNVTTLIVAVILFAVGTGAIKGFAVTLMIGIVTSMFTSITVTRAIVNKIYGGRQVKRLAIGI